MTLIQDHWTGFQEIRILNQRSYQLLHVLRHFIEYQLVFLYNRGSELAYISKETRDKEVKLRLRVGGFSP